MMTTLKKFSYIASIFLFAIFLGICFLYSTACIMTYHPNPNKSKYIQASKDLRRIDQTLAQYSFMVGNYPNSLKELQTPINTPWIGSLINKHHFTDPWDIVYHYYPDRCGYQLYTLGSDRKLGGFDTAFDQLSNNSIRFILSPN